MPLASSLLKFRFRSYQAYFSLHFQYPLPLPDFQKLCEPLNPTKFAMLERIAGTAVENAYLSFSGKYENTATSAKNGISIKNRVYFVSISNFFSLFCF